MLFSEADGARQLEFLDMLGDKQSGDISIPDPAMLQGAAVENAPSFVQEKFRTAKDARSTTENIWLAAWWAYRGEHDPQTRAKIEMALARNPYASKIFVKITKTKVVAAVGQVLDILEADKRFPVTVEATPVPEGVAKHAYLETTQPGDAPSAEDPYGFAGDGKEIPKGSTHKSLLQGSYEKVKEFLGNKTVKEGPAPDKMKLIQMSPAQESATAMDNMIQDQLVECGAKSVVRRLLTEQVIYGACVAKGPFTETRTIHDWKLGEDGKMEYVPIYKDSPKIDFVSCWNFYPDPDAATLQECEYVIQRHLLSRSQIRKLGTQPFFDKESINRVLERKPQYDLEMWENYLQDNGNEANRDRYEVLEYWGFIDAEMARRFNMDLKEDFTDAIQVNIWVSNGELLRIVANPFTPTRIPYLLVPYEANPHQIWGVGVPENMQDSQALMNAHTRMAIDNLMFAGNAVFEINQDNLVPGQNLELYPGKAIYTTGQIGQSINSLKFDNTSESHLRMYDKARQLADEETGIPSYSHGQTGVSGMSRTASGMSMLMGASALNIKTVIKNWDHYFLQPLGEALFAWNMQFNTELPEIRGDLTIRASGTTSLMQREVVTQRILSLIQVCANPLLAPLFNAEGALTELARAMDLDPDVFVNDPKMAALYAEMIGTMNASPQGNVPQVGAVAGPQGAGGNPGATGGVNPQDPTGNGGGNIGPGNAPMPGEAGFAA